MVCLSMAGAIIILFGRRLKILFGERLVLVKELVFDRGRHWHHLANTAEPSMIDGDVALCQITLTTSTISVL